MPRQAAAIPRSVPAATAAGAVAVSILGTVVGASTAAAVPTETSPAPSGTAIAVTDSPSGPDPTAPSTDPSTPTDTPTGTGTTTDTPTDTATTTTGSPTSSPTGSPTQTSTTATTSPTTTPSPSATATVTIRPASAPAVVDSGISVPTLVLAGLVLVLAGGLIALLARRHLTRLGAAPHAEPLPVAATPGALTASLLVELGEAMIGSGYPVAAVQTTLHRVAVVNGAPTSAVVVLPTALLVSVPGQAARETAIAVAGVSRMRLDQVESVAEVVAAAESGAVTAAEARRRLDRARTAAPPYSPALRTAGYVILSVGLATILRASAVEVAVAAVLGALVGLLQLVAPRLSGATQAVLPVAAAFGVSLSVFLLARTGLDVGVFAPLVAPLVTFLPGALLTTAVIELSTGQMISGAGRLAAGVMQLVLLALGIVAAAQLVGVPTTVVGSHAATPLGDIAPWVGVALFGLGVVVHHCARLTSLGWILLVLYVAYGSQVVGGLFLGGVLSAFVGALVMAPVAVFVAAQPHGPPTQVSFLPAFWLLVPGALGLVGLTQLIGPDRSDGLNSLATTAATMVAIALGVLLGLSAGGWIASRALKRQDRLRSAHRNSA